MKTITSTGRTCPPPYIPNSERLTMEQLEGAYDELANGYEKKVWFDQYILGVARQRKQLMSKARGQILDVIVQYLQNHPEALHRGAGDLRMEALEKAWPCH